MLEKYYPYEYAQSVFQIDYQKLYDRGFRGIIFDIDNTLYSYDKNHVHGMKVLAEGVEEKEQAEALKEMECDEIQGFYYSRPQPYEVVEEMLAREEQ